MRVPSREKEKNPAIIKEIGRAQYKHFLDVQRHFSEQALEGTGSLLFDVDNRKVYCSLSVRAHLALLNDFLHCFNNISLNHYKGVHWHSVDQGNNPVYHTNVVMAILKDHVVLCSESIRDKAERAHVMDEITSKKSNKHPR